MRDLEWNVFGERLSKELEKKQLSYRQFAEMVGITTTTVLRYAKCERIPRANEIIKTADVLGVTCDYLLGLSDDPHKTSMSYVIAQPEKEQLSKESTTSDLISRQAVFDTIVQCTNCGDEDTLREYVLKHSLDNGWTGGILEALDAVKDLPPAQPERAKGEWSDGYRWQRCSLCKQAGRISWNFCPHCGADMRGEQHG